MSEHPDARQRRMMAALPADLSSGARLVYWSLLVHASDDLEAWPSVAAQCALTGLAERTVYEHRAELEHRHLVKASSAPGKVTRYRILEPDAGTPAVDRTPAVLTPAVDRTDPCGAPHRTPAVDRTLRTMKDKRRGVAALAAGNGGSATPAPALTVRTRGAPHPAPCWCPECMAYVESRSADAGAYQASWDALEDARNRAAALTAAARTARRVTVASARARGRTA